MSQSAAIHERNRIETPSNTNEKKTFKLNKILLNVRRRNTYLHGLSV